MSRKISTSNNLDINSKNKINQEKFQEYLSDSDNPKWEKIACNGRKFAIEYYNNDKGVSSLVELMRSLL